MIVYQLATEYHKLPSEILECSPWDFSFNVMVTQESRRKIKEQNAGVIKNTEAKRRRRK